jgi:hypothetical protein
MKSCNGCRDDLIVSGRQAEFIRPGHDIFAVNQRIRQV